jgi:hypothetical protein
MLGEDEASGLMFELPEEPWPNGPDVANTVRF